MLRANVVLAIGGCVFTDRTKPVIECAKCGGFDQGCGNPLLRFIWFKGRHVWKQFTRKHMKDYITWLPMSHIFLLKMFLREPIHLRLSAANRTSSRGRESFSFRR